MATPATPQLELEWQFDAPEGVDLVAHALHVARRLGLRLTSSRSVEQVDTYLDTSDWAIRRAGASLRLREASTGAVEATLKQLDGADAGDGPLSRLELSEPVARGALLLEGSTGPVGVRLRAFLDDARLTEEVRVRTKRRALDFADAEGCAVATVAIDATAVEGCEPGRFIRLEVEAASGAAPRARDLANAVGAVDGLRRSKASKLDTALSLAGIAAPRYLRPARPRADAVAAPSLGDLAAASFYAYGGALEEHARIAEIALDPEGVHQTRIVLRRLGTALRVFADILPAHAEALEADARRLVKKLGPARDLDVTTEWIDEHFPGTPGDGLRAIVSEARAAEQRRVVRALRSRRAERVRDGVEWAADSVQRRRAARRRAADETAQLLRPFWRRLRSRYRAFEAEPSEATLHALRIEAKELRYAAQLTRPGADAGVDRLASAAASLQDDAGAFRDETIVVDRLLALVGDTEVGPGTLEDLQARASRGRPLPSGRITRDYRRVRRAWKRVPRHS